MRKQGELQNNKLTMIKKILLLGFLIIPILGFGQSDFSEIDKNSKTVPNSLNDYKEIADYLGFADKVVI